MSRSPTSNARYFHNRNLTDGGLDTTVTALFAAGISVGRVAGVQPRLSLQVTQAPAHTSGVDYAPCLFRDWEEIQFHAGRATFQKCSQKKNRTPIKTQTTQKLGRVG